MNDYMELVDILMDELPEEHPWKGNVKGLVERLIAHGVTIPVHCNACTNSDTIDCSDGMVWCKVMCRYMKEDGFCSLGERENS